MNNYFGINLEFNPNKIHQLIAKAISDNQKGYVCVVDGNVLANAQKNIVYRNIVNNSLINICDGSSIALLASIIYNKKFHTHTGPEIFSFFTSKNYKQLFLGNTEDVLNKLREKFVNEGLGINNMKFLTLPFEGVDQFDYMKISNIINQYSPDIIWVSLGAPKQEIFISKLFPFINRGMIFGIGAAFNLCIDDDNYKRAPTWIRNLKLEWLYRSIKEPNRIGKRAINYCCLLPNLIIQELKNKKNKNFFQNETTSPQR